MNTLHGNINTLHYSMNTLHDDINTLHYNTNTLRNSMNTLHDITNTPFAVLIHYLHKRFSQKKTLYTFILYAI